MPAQKHPSSTAWENYNRSNGGSTIDFWPNTLDNIVWSKDSIFAVAGSENVNLFVPRLKSAASDDKRWDKINIRSNLFNSDEVQLQLPLSWRNFSIGEEMSEGFVHSLDWSPPGLGKHKRCVLAILTSNHVLSIWECVGKPEIASDWVRFYIVNHVLDNHFKTKDTPEPNETEQDRFERFRPQQRVRAFAWSQAPPSISPSGASGDANTNPPYLAVANDRGEVLILEVQSPYNLMFQNSQQWSISVVASFKVDILRGKKSPLAACLPISSQWRTPFVDQLAWSPWVTDSSGAATSILTFTSQSSLQSKLVKLVDLCNRTTVNLGQTIPLLEKELNTQAAGSMKWVPKLRNGKDAFLVYPTRKSFYCMHAQPGLGTSFQTSVQELNNPWDEIAGLSFTQDENENIFLQLAYHLTSGTDRITRLALPFTSESSLGSSSWQHALLEGQNYFSSENELAGNATTRTYGLCIAPFGDMIAINVSYHPSDGIEYAIGSDERSFVTISRLKEDESGPLVFPVSLTHPYEITAEAVLFSLQFMYMQQPKTDIGQENLIESVIQALDLNHAPTLQPNQAMITEDTPVETIVRQIRQNILFNRDSVIARTRQLIKYVKEDIPKIPPLDATIALRIVTEVARLPHFIADASPLSHAIMQIHCLILAKLQARAGNQEAENSAIEDEELEKCEICNGNIPFESLRWARCINNHQFPRCTLSFLAIQTPGTAKSCSICNAQYINEHVVPGFKDSNVPNVESGTDGGQSTQGGSSQEPLFSLARILFAACDRCVCCGGKFTG